MDSLERKKATVITKYAIEVFTASDWYTLGELTGKLKLITNHDRLLRALGFGDEDYGFCAAEVLGTIFSEDPTLIRDVIDHFDIDLWYEQKHPEKYKRLFLDSAVAAADFWKGDCLKCFVSHLSSNRQRMSYLKGFLGKWGISAFIAHEDIEPSREWRDEVEAALETMEVMIAVVEPGFKESEWCCQEVGYALGRRIDVIPLRAGLDPFGFFGKYQGLQIKGVSPLTAALEIVKLLLKKPKYRTGLLQSIGASFASLPSSEKISQIQTLDSWMITTDDQIKTLLERCALNSMEKSSLKDIANRVGAFKAPVSVPARKETEDEIPF